MSDRSESTTSTDNAVKAATPNVLIMVGYGSADKAATQEWKALAEAVTNYLNVPVLPAFLDQAFPSVGIAVQHSITDYRPQRAVILPMFLGASEARKKNVLDILEAASESWEDVAMQYGAPLGVHPGVIAAYSQLITAAVRTTTTDVPASETTLLVVARGSRDPESNAEVYHMARRFWEDVRFGAVEIAFTGTTSPDIATTLKRCVQNGAKRIVVLPYLLYEATLYQTIRQQIEPMRGDLQGVELIITEHLGIHKGIVEAVARRYAEALMLLTNEKSGRRGGLFSHAYGGSSTHTHDFTRFAQHTAAPSILPPRYQDELAVSAAPMGAADLKFGADGKVAWDEIWGDFCDLALAGGPPHRGTLLEPVSPEAVEADPISYERVIAELERGLRMVTKLPVITDGTAGWIGLRCDSEEMALWMLRAIVVENVSVRREDSVLYFPAGPTFRLEKEIKNVITVVAKTHHYWTEHVNSQAASHTAS